MDQSGVYGGGGEYGTKDCGDGCVAVQYMAGRSINVGHTTTHGASVTAAATASFIQLASQSVCRYAGKRNKRKQPLYLNECYVRAK